MRYCLVLPVSSRVSYKTLPIEFQHCLRGTEDIEKRQILKFWVRGADLSRSVIKYICRHECIRVGTDGYIFGIVHFPAFSYISQSFFITSGKRITQNIKVSSTLQFLFLLYLSSFYTYLNIVFSLYISTLFQALAFSYLSLHVLPFLFVSPPC